MIPVATDSGSYEVKVGPGLIGLVGEAVGRLTPGARCLLVTDENVAGLYAATVADSIRQAGSDVFTATQPVGETAKSWRAAGALLELMAEHGLGRDSVIVALGGGVVGDLAGFVASTYMRGVPVIQVPTSLLAQVDSSIGGKTGVDLEHGKNLAGTYWQPLEVLVDTACLATLPEQEWRCGFAEVAKSAILAGEEPLRALESAAPALVAGNESAVTAAVVAAAGFKVGVVSADERESGAREQLNYGHTLGHALERELGYGAVSHGVAVAEGIRFAGRMSARLAGASEEWVVRQQRLLDDLGLTRRFYDIAPDRLVAAMHADKKARAAAVRFVLSAGPGLWSTAAVDDGILLAELISWRDTGKDFA
jgi:3-dehydroquinate synthase